MKDSAPIIQRALKREQEKVLAGTIVSFTRLMHPAAQFGKKPRLIGIVELENKKRVLAPLLMENPTIGQAVSPRMRLSHVAHDGLRVYGVAYDAAVPKKIRSEFPGYILALTGPSGVGKSTISQMLTAACADYTERTPIVTTRETKSGENGEYIHVTKREFADMKRRGIIVASTDIASSGEDRLYGYRATDLEAIWSRGKVPVVITEMNLLEGLSSHYGRRSVLSFGLLPPGKSKRAMLSQLLHRLRIRGRESEQHMQDRIKNAERDLAFFSDRKDLFDHMVVNEDLASTIAGLKKKVLVLVRA